jgi:hypothetical protein
MVVSHMDTEWTDQLCRQAFDALRETRFRSALKHLTTVLSVYPDHAKALKLAETVLYMAQGRARNANAAEPLSTTELFDSRLDSLFCSCDTQGCSASWISSHAIIADYGHKAVSNPIGGACSNCGAYTCRKHFASGSLCPQCGGKLDFSPPPNGVKSPRQTVRLNKPVVHAVLLREGPLSIEPNFVDQILTYQAPDIREDQASIRGFATGKWPDDPMGVGTALLARDHPEYLGKDFLVHSFSGYTQDGIHWALVKVFRNVPKYIDPSA